MTSGNFSWRDADASATFFHEAKGASGGPRGRLQQFYAREQPQQPGFFGRFAKEQGMSRAQRRKNEDGDAARNFRPPKRAPQLHRSEPPETAPMAWQEAEASGPAEQNKARRRECDRSKGEYMAWRKAHATPRQHTQGPAWRRLQDTRIGTSARVMQYRRVKVEDQKLALDRPLTEQGPPCGSAEGNYAKAPGVPKHMKVTAPERPSVEGLYELMTGPRGRMEVNGRPVWADGDKRLYKSQRGSWMLALHAVDIERNACTVRSAYACADQFLPERVEEWEYCVGRPDGALVHGRYDEGPPRWAPCTVKCVRWACPSPPRNGAGMSPHLRQRVRDWPDTVYAEKPPEYEAEMAILHPDSLRECRERPVEWRGDPKTGLPGETLHAWHRSRSQPPMSVEGPATTAVVESWRDAGRWDPGRRLSYRAYERMSGIERTDVPGCWEPPGVMMRRAVSAEAFFDRRRERRDFVRHGPLHALNTTGSLAFMPQMLAGDVWREDVSRSPSPHMKARDASLEAQRRMVSFDPEQPHYAFPARKEKAPMSVESPFSPVRKARILIQQAEQMKELAMEKEKKQKELRASSASAAGGPAARGTVTPQSRKTAMPRGTQMPRKTASLSAKNAELEMERKKKEQELERLEQAAAQKEEDEGPRDGKTPQQRRRDKLAAKRRDSLEARPWRTPPQGFSNEDPTPFGNMPRFDPARAIVVKPNDEGVATLDFEKAAGTEKAAAKSEKGAAKSKSTPKGAKNRAGKKEDASAPPKHRDSPEPEPSSLPLGSSIVLDRTQHEPEPYSPEAKSSKGDRKRNSFFDAPEPGDLAAAQRSPGDLVKKSAQSHFKRQAKLHRAPEPPVVIEGLPGGIGEAPTELGPPAEPPAEP